jgi:hypothetical protein
VLSNRIHLASTRCTGMFPNGAQTGSRPIPTHPLATLTPRGLPMVLARSFAAAAIPTRHFLRHPIGGRVMSLAPAAATSAYDPFLSCLLGRPLTSANPVFAVFPGVRHFFWQPCYAFPIGMSVEARRLPATRHRLAVWGVSGVLGSPMNHKNPNQLLRRYASAIGMSVEARRLSAAQTPATVWGVSGVQGALGDAVKETHVRPGTMTDIKQG